MFSPRGKLTLWTWKSSVTESDLGTAGEKPRGERDTMVVLQSLHGVTESDGRNQQPLWMPCAQNDRDRRR
jgi:hypothetical protein